MDQIKNNQGLTRRWRWGLTTLALGLVVTGCVRITGVYIDPTLPPASAAEVRPAKHPTAVQLLVEFRAHDVPKAGPTVFTQGRLLDIGRKSGLFSAMSTDPVPGGRRLVVTIDDDAGPRTGSPEITGLTFGAAGTAVTDAYHWDVSYDVPDHAPISLAYEHRLISTIGVASGPPGLTSYSTGAAVTMITDQLGWSIMRDLSARHATEE
jgi:hypothetical protein